MASDGVGKWSPTTGGNNRGRLTWQIDQSPVSVGAGTASVTLKLRVWYESRFSVVDSSNAYTISGAWTGSGSKSVSHGASGGTTLLYDDTISVPTSTAGTVKRSFTAAFSGINATPSIPSVSGSHTVAKRPVNPPSAATDVTPTRSSDTKYTISWTPGAGAASQRVERRTFGAAGWGAWQSVSGSLGAGVSSWTDTGTKANHAYAWRVITTNAGGSTPSSDSPTVRTTPAAPTNVSAYKNAGGDIFLTFNATQPYGESVTFLVEGRKGSGAWEALGTSTSETFLHESPDPAAAWSYRVATKVALPVALTSAWSATSNTVALLGKPNPPTITGPSGALDRDAPITFTWLHNPVDTTAQVGYQLRYRVNGSSWTTLVGADDLTRTLGALGISGTLEWQVRTNGAHPDWSDWSAIASVTLAARPTVAINTPDGSDLPQSRVDLLIGYFQSDGSAQSRVQAELVRDGRVVETLNWSGTGDTGSFATALENATEYTVRVRVQAGNGLWSDWDSVTFTTDFPSPVPFEVGAEWDRESGAVIVSGEALREPATGEMEAQFLTYQRRDHEDAPWVTLVADVEPGTTVVDPVPALGAPEYRVISHTDLPSSTTGPVTVVPLPRGFWPVYLNTGPGFQDTVALYDNTQYSPNTERGKTRHRRAGRRFPVTKWGAHRDHSYTLTATVSPTSPGSSVTDVQALEDEPYVACYRDVLGHKHFVTVDSISASAERDGRWSLTVPMTREDVDEATELAGGGA